ncbi:MAG: rhodanese [Candidatus Melainabacteria bacterium HGW-Melainabacteria-1]|nr:MAG: rhodanese [Candidatus Melainabacteria bacterium HGW-Melainabacteria-1]
MDSIEISVQEAAALLQSSADVRLIDVREDFEREICCIKSSQQLTETLAEDMIQNWDRGQQIVFQCHHGGRSRAAAEYFIQQGFSQVRNLNGGIDAWSREIDPSLARY